MASCKEAKEETRTETEVQATTTEQLAYFGGKLEEGTSLSAGEFMTQLKDMKVGDSIAVKLEGDINSVCQKKGCWMRVAAGEEELMVRFKDYGFFVPKDAAGKETIIQGYAFVEETSVEDLKHYAMDAGKSEDEIAAITAPKRTYSFTADAVAIAQ